MNTIMSVYKSRTHSEQEDFMKQLCRTHAPLLCAAIRKMGDERDIFCKRLVNEIKKRANEE